MPSTGDRRALRRLVGLVGLIALGLALAPAFPRATLAAVSSSFVTSSGTQLMLDGQPFYFSGFNIYNASSNGWCRSAYSQPMIEASFDEIGGGNAVARSWFFQPLATTAGGARDWTKFDQVIAAAHDRNVHLVVTLTDQWTECGAELLGYDGYKPDAWYQSGYTVPDPALAAVYGAGWKSYRDWVAEVVSRYGNEPAILAWQLINEATVKPSEASGACTPGAAQILTDWATDMSNYIRSLDPNHLISLGTIGNGQCGSANDDYKSVHALPNIDLCEYHDYSTDLMPGDTSNGLQRRLDQCAELNKPLFVGEVGISRDIAGGLPARATLLADKIAAQKTAGVAGHLVWQYAQSDAFPEEFDVYAGSGDPVFQVVYDARQPAPVPTPTATPTPSATPCLTPTPTLPDTGDGGTPGPTGPPTSCSTPTPSATPTATPTPTPTPSATPTDMPTDTPPPSPTPGPTCTPAPPPTPGPSGTAEPQPSSDPCSTPPEPTPTPELGDITGYLSSDGTPVVGAVVYACSPLRCGVSDPSAGDGFYQVSALPAASYDLVVYAPTGSNGFADPTGPVTVAAGQLAHDIELPTGRLQGQVTDAIYSAVPYAYLEACGVSTGCHGASVDAGGFFDLSYMLPDQYSVTIYPPSSSYFITNVAPPITIDTAVVVQNLIINSTVPLPSDGSTSISGSGVISGGGPGTVPSLRVGPPINLHTVGCSGGSATFTVTSVYDGNVPITGALTETSAGVYDGAFTINFGGPATISIAIDCPGPTPDEDVSFNVYIDPSGFVRNTFGQPVVGATVTLYQGPTPDGPWTVVPDGSAIMSPANRTNPDLTDAVGHFGWDVVAGFYKVRAQRAGCASAADHSVLFAETGALQVPPPVLDLDIRLFCGTYQPTKLDVLAQLTSAASSAARKQDAHKIGEAAKNLADSLDPGLWLDGDRLAPKVGAKVFEREKECVQKLSELLSDRKSGVSRATLQAWIDALVAVDRGLAESAIAAAASGNAKSLNEAAKEMAKAAADVADGRPASAIEHYKNAWKKAQEALRKG